MEVFVMADNKQYINQSQENGCILISEDVISTIVSHAVSEVEGVVSLSGKPGADIVELIGKITSLYLQNIRSVDKNWSPWAYLFSMSLKMKRTIDPEALKMLGIRIPHEMQLFVMGAATPSRRLQGDQLKYLQSQLATWMPT